MRRACPRSGRCHQEKELELGPHPCGNDPSSGRPIACLSGPLGGARCAPVGYARPWTDSWKDCTKNNREGWQLKGGVIGKSPPGELALGWSGEHVGGFLPDVPNGATKRDRCH